MCVYIYSSLIVGLSHVGPSCDPPLPLENYLSLCCVEYNLYLKLYSEFVPQEFIVTSLKTGLFLIQKYDLMG